nr:MAG TPA: hypothetical protein [Caudoviricetes sp.]
MACDGVRWGGDGCHRHHVIPGQKAFQVAHATVWRWLAPHLAMSGRRPRPVDPWRWSPHHAQFSEHYLYLLTALAQVRTFSAGNGVGDGATIAKPPHEPGEIAAELRRRVAMAIIATHRFPSPTIAKPDLRQEARP